MAGLVATAALAMVPAVAEAGTGGTSPTGSPASNPDATVPGSKAKLVHGEAVAPADAPRAVKRVIAAANKIRTKPYKYGGGHGKWRDKGYDCSGAVSFALHGARLLRSPLDSSGLAKWEESGEGSWISVYGNPGHAYMVVAGLRFDTSNTRGGDGPRWSRSLRSTSGRFAVRHPEGL